MKKNMTQLIAEAVRELKNFDSADHTRGNARIELIKAVNSNSNDYENKIVMENMEYCVDQVLAAAKK